MDARLVAWARRVKARAPKGPPPLWLFTDPVRLPEPLAAIGRLPRGLAGVVLRDGDATLRARAQCRRHGIACSGTGRFAGGGAHLRGGIRKPGPAPLFVTSSAHSAAEVRRARQAGAMMIFLSPVFATASHPGVATLGVGGWLALARGCPGRAAALGGVDGHRARFLPPCCRAIGAISALSPYWNGRKRTVT